MTNQVIPQLSSMLGLSCAQVTDDGEEIAISEQFLTQVLADFGFTAHFDEVLAEQLKQFWLRALPPLIQIESQAEIIFDLHLPIEFVTEELIWEISAGGQIIENGLFTPVEWELNGIYHLHDMEIQSYQICLEQPLTTGQYQLRILDQGSDEPLGESILICPPQGLNSQLPVPANIQLTLIDLDEIDIILQRVAEHGKIVLPVSAQTRTDRLTALHAFYIAATEDNAAGAVRTATAEPAQRVLAHYLAASSLRDEQGIASYSVTKLQEWQTQYAQQIDFYLWLILQAQATPVKGMTRAFQYAVSTSGLDFQSWLLADYKLANCISGMSSDNLPDNVLDKPLNSYKLREQGYEELLILLSHLISTADTLLLTDVLGMLQQWICLNKESEAQGTWLNHPFQELLAIIMQRCEQESTRCLVQDSASLPEELRQYLQELGLPLVQ